jgi:hypothetical protein
MDMGMGMDMDTVMDVDINMDVEKDKEMATDKTSEFGESMHRMYCCGIICLTSL